MANSTWLVITNNVLRQSGLPEIPVDSKPVANDPTTWVSAAFDNPTQGLMTRYQIAAREFVRIMHEKISVDLPVNFARRRFQLNVDNLSGAIYPLNTGMSVESLTFDSFRNLSVSPPGPGRLRNWTYEYFTIRYPDVTQIYSGAPTHYILLPPLQSDQSPVYRVRIFPTPDKAYQLEYVAQLNPYSLSVSTDVILWPPEYEHVLSDMARFNLEDLLGEGKAGTLSMQAERAYQKARQKATPPRAERKGVRMKRMFIRRGVFGYYDSPPDSDAPYVTPDTIR